LAEFIALLLATLTGMLGSGISDKDLAAKVQQELMEKKPVPMEKVQVTCKGASKTGVDQLTFTIDGLLLDPLTVDHATITIGGIKPEKGGKVAMKSVSWTADIAEQQLTSVLRTHVVKLSDATVNIAPDGISLAGTYPVMLKLRVPYTVTGDLAVEQQTQLMFRIRESGLSGVNMPAGLNSLLEREINPVYDLAKFAARSKKDIERAKQKLDYSFMLNVDELKPAEGHIIVTGSA
jgi:hypothetical protein